MSKRKECEENRFKAYLDSQKTADAKQVIARYIYDIIRPYLPQRKAAKGGKGKPIIIPADGQIKGGAA